MSDVLLDSTPLIIDGAGNATAVIPVLPAGPDRNLIITVQMYNGATNSRTPTLVTANSQDAAYITGDPVGVDIPRVALASYVFFEHQIPYIEGQILSTSGQGGTLKSVEYCVLQNRSQQLPINKNYGTQASGTITLPLTREANSITVARGACSSSSTNLTFANPARAGSVGSTRLISYANVVDTARTADFTSSTSSSYTHAHVFNVKEVSAQTIVSVNGGAGINAGSTGNTAVLTGFGGASTSGTFASKALTNLGGTATNPTFDFGGFVDGQTFPLIGSSQNIIFNYLSETAVLSVVANSAAGMTPATVDTPDLYDPKKLGFHLKAAGYTPVNGDLLIGTDADATWLPDTGGSAPSVPVTTPVWHRVLATGIMYGYLVTINADGTISASRNLIAGSKIKGNLIKGNLIKGYYL